MAMHSNIASAWTKLSGRIGIGKASSGSPFNNTVFHDAAIRLAAMVALVDEIMCTQEFEWLKLSLGEEHELQPQAQQLFEEQKSVPQTLPQILSAFLIAFDRPSPEGETLLTAIATVATVDGPANVDQVIVLRSAGDVLGLRYDVINRVLVAAGISLSTRHLDERVFRRRGPSGDGIAESASERAQHLSILGLPSGATELEAKEAYRALVKKYHPDRLAGRGASAETLVRAEAIMVKLNAAYKGLAT